MKTYRKPTKGFWWISLDDSREVICDPLLVRVDIDADGYTAVEALDDSGYYFSIQMPEIDIAMLWQRSQILGMRTSSERGEHRITWLAPVNPPRAAPTKETLVTT